MTTADVLFKLPYSEPFLFVDDILHIDDESITGTYTFRQDLFFYKGHFKDNPVTPGVILTETMGQIGLACLGIYLLRLGREDPVPFISLTSNDVHFLKPVFPGEKVTVTSKKAYFRFGKLSCKVSMENEKGEVVCKGIIMGMIIQAKHGQ